LTAVLDFPWQHFDTETFAGRFAIALLFNRLIAARRPPLQTRRSDMKETPSHKES